MLVELRHPTRAVPPVTHVRSTGTVACLHLLDVQGLRARYDANLPAPHRPAIAEMVSGMWIDAEVAIAHFRAVDMLDLSTAELHALGLSAGEGVLRYQTSTLLRMSREIGINPWTVLPHAQRMWDRMCKGGDVSIERAGPKEVLTTLHHGQPALASSAYFRTMIRGTFHAGLALWCTRAYVTEVAATPLTLVLRETWA